MFRILHQLSILPFWGQPCLFIISLEEARGPVEPTDPQHNIGGTSGVKLLKTVIETMFSHRKTCSFEASIEAGFHKVSILFFVTVLYLRETFQEIGVIYAHSFKYKIG